MFWYLGCWLLLSVVDWGRFFVEGTWICYISMNARVEDLGSCSIHVIKS